MRHGGSYWYTQQPNILGIAVSYPSTHAILEVRSVRVPHVNARLWSYMRMVPLPQDPEYLALVNLYATDQEALDIAFSNAW